MDVLIKINVIFVEVWEFCCVTAVAWFMLSSRFRQAVWNRFEFREIQGRPNGYER